MKKTLSFFDVEFCSSCGDTRYFLDFCKTFRREFKKLLEKHGCTDPVFHKGHFELSVFFTNKNGQPIYAHLSDCRYFSKDMIFRRCKDYKDFHGECNRNTSLELIEQDFERLAA